MDLAVVDTNVLKEMLRQVVREELSRPKPKVYLTVEQTAKKLGCSTSTVRNNKDVIGAHQPGGEGTAIRFELENVEAYMERNK